MPGFLLDLTAVVNCLHTGPAIASSVYPRVRINGSPIVHQAIPYSITGCSLAAGGNPPCVMANWVQGAARVRAGGIPVLLQDSQAVCTPTGTGLVVLSTQTRVRGI